MSEAMRVTVAETTRAQAAPATDWSGYGAFAGASLIWGSTFLVIAFSNEYLAPLWGATLRLAIASVGLITVALLTGARFPRGAQLRDLALYGILSFGFNLSFLYWGEKSVPSGITAVVFATAPLQTALYARVLGVERLDRIKVFSAVVAVVGVGTIFAGQLGVGVPALPLAAVFGAAMVSALGAVILRRAGRHSPWTVNAIGAPLGAAFCLAVSVAVGEPRAIPSGLAEWWPVLYLAVLGSLGAYVLFAFLVNRWSATSAAFIGVVVPVIALILGALIRHESPPLISFAGAAIVIAAVVVALTRSKGAAH